MQSRTARRFELVQESATVAVADMVKRLSAQGVSVCDLGGGDPDFATAPHIVDAAERAMRQGFTHYVSSRGIRPLLTAISRLLEERNGLDYDPLTEIIVTPSAKHAAYIALLTILDPGDELLVPSPSWVSYEAMVHMIGAVPVFVPLPAEGGFRLNRELLEAQVTPRTKAILLNSPNNPTGHVMNRDEVEMVVHFAEERDLLIVSDEIYDRIVYDGSSAVSPAALPGARQRTITINGFSKAYAMTGWRLGFLAAPADIAAEALKAHQHTVGCAGSFVQVAGVAALEGSQDIVDEMVREYDARRKLVVDGLNSLPGILCPMPEGAFYAFPNVTGTGFANSVEFSTWLIEKARVAVTPGSAFGPGGEGHVRLSFANSSEIISEAIERMRLALESRVAAR